MHYYLSGTQLRQYQTMRFIHLHFHNSDYSVAIPMGPSLARPIGKK